MKVKTKQAEFDAAILNTAKIFYTPFGCVTGRSGDCAVEIVKGGYIYAFEPAVFNMLFDIIPEEQPEENKEEKEQSEEEKQDGSKTETTTK